MAEQSAPFSSGAALLRRAAESEAHKFAAAAIEPVHLWLALCKLARLDRRTFMAVTPGDMAFKSQLADEIAELSGWFSRERIDVREAYQKAEEKLRPTFKQHGEIHRSRASISVFVDAALIASRRGAETANLVHIAEALRAFLSKQNGLQGGHGDQGEPPAPAAKGPGKASSVLARFGRDLTALAEDGKLSPVIGRHDEIRRLARTLSRKHKSNALLVGEAGVGKTAIVEGLAQLVTRPEAVAALQGIRIYEISMTSLVAKTGQRGDFEARVEAILEEASKDRNAVLFIDEFHTVLGGGHSGSDASNMLKPALARGEIRMIGATTGQEYQRFIAREEAFDRRFEVIWVEEPSHGETLEILKGLRSGLEQHHHIEIPDQALEAAVRLSSRYIQDRKLPDKALDVLDQACSELSVPTITPGAAVDPSRPRVLGNQDIAKVVAERCRIPVDLLSLSDAERLSKLEPFLTARIAGQDEAEARVASALLAAFAGVRDPKRPVASFLFTGPTGVGKTETAKLIAEFLFGSQEALVAIDLSEYSEKHQIARLVGAPAGYIRSDEPGVLTAAIRKRPSSVVLFDEIEKAHPDVLNLLLQILDEGRLTDGLGRPASFREAIVVMTTNLTAETRPQKHIGFGQTTDPAESPEDPINVLKRHVKPEILGRVGAIVPFRQIGREALPRLVKVLFDSLVRRLEAEGKPIPPESLCENLIEELQDAPLGARQIERRLEEAVARWLTGSRPGEA